MPTRKTKEDLAAVEVTIDDIKSRVRDHINKKYKCSIHRFAIDHADKVGLKPEEIDKGIGKSMNSMPVLEKVIAYLEMPIKISRKVAIERTVHYFIEE